ncbi:uncharacterized protein LOC134339750 isoform X2 [Mobula hypostoma]|uniref:uncharacterized protein LOC134339750 isoform X2 n=1 Tax=Mobula hypostoma TaxID=723540 RepID=UPI002FC3D954
MSNVAQDHNEVDREICAGPKRNCGLPAMATPLCSVPRNHRQPVSVAPTDGPIPTSACSVCISGFPASAFKSRTLVLVA